MKKTGAILVAAGRSERMAGADKLALMLGGLTVLQQSARRLQESALVHEIVAVTRPEKIGGVRALLSDCGIRKLKDVVAGGGTRFLSVKNGLLALSGDVDYVAVHDAARPFVSETLVTATIEAAFCHGAAASAVPVTDTVKLIGTDGFVKDTPDRALLRAAATPQVFEAALFREAVRRAKKEDYYDDCSVVEEMGVPVFLLPGETGNKKITTAEDLRMADGTDGGLRVGHGYDVHRFSPERALILGGVRIPFEMGLDGHSDADVLAHAVIDALLGAAAMGDIGLHFPDTDEAYRGADSLELLQRTAGILRAGGFAIRNIDATLLCERPKIRPYTGEMRARIAAAAGIAEAAVNVKATTEEGLGFTGAMQGIAAHAVALIEGARRIAF